MDDVEQFFPKRTKKAEEDLSHTHGGEPKRTEATKSQKRKKEDEDDIEDLRHKARAYCTSPAEYRRVTKLPRSKLEDFIEEKTWEAAQKVADTFILGLHQGLAQLLDSVAKGGGFVEQEIIMDMALRESLQEEAKSIYFLLSNKIKILTLSFLDTLHGKRNQRKGHQCTEAPVESCRVEVVPERQDNDTSSATRNTSPQETQEAGSAATFGLD